MLLTGCSSAPVATPVVTPFHSIDNAHALPSSVLNTTARPTTAGAGGEGLPGEFFGEGRGQTPSFTLKGGDYRVDWQAFNPNTSGVPCYFAPALQGAGFANVAGLDIDTTKQDTANVHGLEAGTWYFDVITGCNWTLRIRR